MEENKDIFEDVPHDRLPRNYMELTHRRIVNTEGQPLIVLAGSLYWAGSGKYIGPVAMLKPTCPKEYYFCDYCGGTFTLAFSADDGQKSLAKHYELEHRDIVVQRIPQPKGVKGGFWTPTEGAVAAAARELAGEHPKAEERDPVPVILPVDNLKEANKKPVKTARLITEPAAK